MGVSDVWRVVTWFIGLAWPITAFVIAAYIITGVLRKARQ